MPRKQLEGRLSLNEATLGLDILNEIILNDEIIYIRDIMIWIFSWVESCRK